MYFDAKAARLLKPGDHALVTGCGGLRLEVTASRKTWTYRYKSNDGGKLKQVAIGAWPAMSLAAAVAEWGVLRDLRDAGTDPVKRRVAPPVVTSTHETYTVRAAVQDFITGHLLPNRSPDSGLAARRALEAVLDANPDFADTPAAGVSRALAYSVIDSRKATPTAADKLRSLFGSAWDFAIDAGKLHEDAPNRWRDVLKGKLKSKGKIVGGVHVGQERRVLSDDEVAFLLQWLPNMHQLGRDTTTLYLGTCARGVEILSMRPEYITLERGLWWWTVPKRYTKNADSPFAVDLRVPLFGRALEVVQRRLKDVGPSGWLFEKAGARQYLQKDYSTYINSLFAGSSKDKRRQGDGLILPMKNWTPHNLRRTGRTLLARLGCTNEVGEAVIGHLPEVIVSTYNLHSYDTERLLWLAKLDAHLETLASSVLPARP